MPDFQAFAAKLRELLSMAEEPHIEIYSEGGETRIFLPFSEPAEWIPYLPVPARYEHKVYGAVDLTDRNPNFVKNFSDGVYQNPIPIDLEHGTKQSGAAGWVEEMRLNENGSVDARVKWTDRGRDVLGKDRYRFFSPEIAPTWTDHNGKEHRDVPIGGALTTRPFFKALKLPSIAANEDGTTDPPQEGDMSDDKKADQKPVETAQFSAQQYTEMTQKYADVQAANEKLVADNQKFAERLALVETENRRKAFTDEVRGKSDANNIRWFGEEAKHVAMLEKLTQAFGEGSEEVTDYVAQNREAAKRVHASGVFNETGVRGTALSGSDAEKLDVAVQKYREAHPDATPEQAKAQVYSENPGLVRAVRSTTKTNVEAS